MNINFLSRKEMKDALEKGIPNKDQYAFISINDTSLEELEMNSLFSGNMIPYYVTTTFSDDDTGMSKSASGYLFRFIRENHHKSFIIHCFDGISRSGAIAKFINEYYEAGNRYLEDYQGHDKKVYNQMLAEAGLSLSAYYEELEEQDRMI